MFSLLFFLTLSFSPSETKASRGDMPHQSPAATILLALQLEQRNAFTQAAHYWKSLNKIFPRDIELQSRYRKALLISGDTQALLKISFSFLNGAESAEFKLLLSRIYFWRGNIAKAEEVLIPVLTKNRVDRFFLFLELAKLKMFSGNYQNAAGILSELHPMDKNQKFMLHYSWLSLFVLQNQQQKMQHIIQAMEKDYFYFPLEGLEQFFPQRMLLRFPSLHSYFDLLIRQYHNKKDWPKFGALIRSAHVSKINRFESTPNIFLGEFLLHQRDKRTLRSLLKVKLGENPIQRYWLDLAARLAEQNKNWQGLKYYANALISHYPQILDGKFYLMEYYNKTRQKTKYRALQKELRSTNLIP